MIQCTNCQTLNAPGKKFCHKCGQPLLPSVPPSPTPVPQTLAVVRGACPRCQVPLRLQTRFCPACGLLIQPSSAGGPAAPPPPDRPAVIVHAMGGQTTRHPLHKPMMRVGRAPDNDIVLNFPTVSGHHLRLDVSGDTAQVTDLGSTNGTALNGRFLTPNNPAPFQPGDMLRIADQQGNSVGLSLSSGAGQELSPRPLGMHALAQYNQAFIGRDNTNQVVLDHPSISRRHAEISRQGNGFALRDLGSANGTFVNGQRIVGWISLNAGDVIQVGPFKLVYDHHIQRLTGSISRGHQLDVVGLGMQVSNGRMILNNISLTVNAGEFIALVGGSGAGKSTLMKAMNGYNPATHGQMLIDGEPLYPNLELYRTVMGYVPQDDIIHKELPVRRALWYAARLRLPDANSQEIEQRIQDVLQIVDMTDHASKPVNVLSGGQRKRVSIAVELLAQPNLLFLDEPTSGLDPGLEKKMMHDLNRLADRGKTVVLVTHATINIEQCNHVAFLAAGRLAYYGPPQEAIQFFQARDFADIYLQLSQLIDPANGKPPPPILSPHYKAIQPRLKPGNTAVPAATLWAEHYQHSPQHQRYVAQRQAHLGGGGAGSPVLPAQRPARTRDSSLRQGVILARRQLDLIRFNRATLFILLLMMPIIALLFMAVSNKEDLTGLQLSTEQIDQMLKDQLEGRDIGEKESYIPAPTAQQLITMLGLALTQAGTFGAAYEIVKERAIFKRERAVNLRVGAYVVAKIVVLSLFAVFQVASVLLILSLRVDLGFEPIFDFFPQRRVGAVCHAAFSCAGEYYVWPVSLGDCA
jgi:ABC transport system ATP-binding/permease protein